MIVRVVSSMEMIGIIGATICIGDCADVRVRARSTLKSHILAIRTFSLKTYVNSGLSG